MATPFKLPDRFWAKVQKTDGCWLWTGYRSEDGYGQVGYQGRVWKATRLLMASLGNDIDGFIVRHSCDTPPCVNPDHLLLGSYTDNARDSKERKRNAHGERHASAKLTDDLAKEIYEAFARLPRNASGYVVKGERQKLAERFGAPDSVVRNVITGATWSHVTGGVSLVCGRKRASRFRGVGWHRTSKRWRAFIQHNRTFIHLGHFTTELEAAFAYDKAAVELHGALAKPNFPERFQGASVS